MFTQGTGLAPDAMFSFTQVPTATTGTKATQFYVRAVDADQVTSQRTGAVEQAVTAVSGRLLVANVDGSPSSNMPVTLQAQFYDDNRRGFVFNPMYEAPAKALAGFLRFDRCQKGLTSNAATFACTSAAQLQLVQPGQATFTGGKADFRLVPPGRARNPSERSAIIALRSCMLETMCSSSQRWLAASRSTRLCGITPTTRPPAACVASAT